MNVLPTNYSDEDLLAMFNEFLGEDKDECSPAAYTAAFEDWKMDQYHQGHIGYDKDTGDFYRN